MLKMITIHIPYDSEATDKRGNSLHSMNGESGVI